MGEITSGIKEKIETAESLITSHEYQKATDLLLDVIDFFEVIGDFKNRNTYLLKLNQCYDAIALNFREQKDYFEAAEIYCSAAFLQKEHDNSELAHQLFNKAIECFVCAGKTAITKKSYRDASTSFCSAAKIAKNELYDKIKPHKYYQDAIEVLQKNLTINSNSDDPSTICRNNLELGKIYEYLENYQTAIKLYKKVVDFSIKEGLYSFTAESFQHISACHECLDDYPAMIDCLNNAVHYRLVEAEKYSESDLPLEAVQNFIAAANCVSRLKDSDALLMDILQSEANCFLTAARLNEEDGKVLQAAYYERNAAYCYNQLGKSETSIDLLLTAAEKLLSIDEYYGAAYNYQDVSLYQEQVGNFVKAANYALKAANSAQQSGDLDFAIQNFKRAAQIYQSIGYSNEVHLCNLKLAECFINLAELNLKSSKFHIAAFLYYKTAIIYSKSNYQEKTILYYEKAIEFYEKAIKLAIMDEEELLASYSACCATLVCLIMMQPARAESILKNIRDNSSNNYYQLSDSVIKAFKTKNSHDYKEIHQKFHKIIQNSSEIKNMFYLTKNYL